MGFFDGAAGGIASGIGGIVSSIFGNKAQRDANKANLQIAQMNNEWSERMMEKQHAYDLENREYNTPENQAARVRAAGLNPALAMQNINTGNATSQSASLPSPSSATMQPVPYRGVDGLIDAAVSTAMQIDKNMAEVDFMRTQSDVMKAKAKAEIAELGQRTKGLVYDNDYKEATKSLRVASANESYLTEVNNRLLKEEQRDIAKQTRILNDIQITHLPAQMQADIALKLAQVEYQGTTDMAKDLKFFEKKYGVKLSKSDIKVIFDAWKQNLETQQYRGLDPFNTLIGVLNRD